MPTDATIVKPTAPLFDEARLAVAGFLARSSGATRTSYATDLRQFFTWCAQCDLELDSSVAGQRGLASADEDGTDEQVALIDQPSLESRVARCGPHKVGDEREQLVVGLGPIEAALLVLDVAVEGRVRHVDQLRHAARHGSALTAFSQSTIAR